MQETLGSASSTRGTGVGEEKSGIRHVPTIPEQRSWGKRLEVHPWLHTKFEGSLGYIHPEKETKQKQRKKISFLFST